MLTGTACLIAALGLLTEPGPPRDSVCHNDGTNSGTYTLRRTVEEVRVAFTLERPRGRSAAHLTREDIFILEDGLPVPAITSFYRGDDTPSQLALIVDRSDSMRGQFAAEQSAANEVLSVLSKASADQMTLTSFATGSRTANGKSAQVLSASLKGLHAEGQTALYDTLYSAAQHFHTTSANNPARRAIILLSDGEDSWSKHSLEDAIVAAQQADVAIYAVTAHNRRLEFAGDRVLSRLADATGGRAFVLSSYNDLHKVLAAIAADLRTQYVIGFHPRQGDGRYHTVKVLVRGGRLKLRARTGYYAEPDCPSQER